MNDNADINRLTFYRFMTNLTKIGQNNFKNRIKLRVNFKDRIKLMIDCIQLIVFNK